MLNERVPQEQLAGRLVLVGTTAPGLMDLRATPVSIYEPLGEEGKVSRDDLEGLKLWNQALRAYRAQAWDQAEVMLLNLTRINPCYLYDLYGERIQPHSTAFNRIQPHSTFAPRAAR